MWMCLTYHLVGNIWEICKKLKNRKLIGILSCDLTHIADEVSYIVSHKKQVYGEVVSI